MLDKTKRGWWRSAVFYQIYPKSFMDSDGDGLGDIPGVISKLDYLQNLGVDGIWLSPVMDSPQADNGYDVADYRAIWPPFGTMSDMEKLISEARSRGISVIMDLVLNHTSDEHRWFREALKGRDNPYHDYYVWRDGEPGTPPNDMRSCFGGSAWEYVPELGQYYFHQFAVKQPDLNWDDPRVRRELYDMIRFWVDKGVEGFRLDVIDSVAKEPDRKITARGPRLHQYIRELSREAFIEEGLVTVGEAWSADVEEARRWSSPDGAELSMVFQFQHIQLDQQPGGEKWDMVPLSLPKLKRCIESWQLGLHGTGWNSLFMNNHDLPRVVSRWGDEGEYRERSAKALATMLHGLEGTPYIYQGEELGMRSAKPPLEGYEDLETLNMISERRSRGYSEESITASAHGRSRDCARTPMHWTSGKNAGFTRGEPWFAVSPDYVEINAERELADPDSVFYYYKKLIGLRKSCPAIQSGDFRLLCPDDSQVFAYVRSCGEQRVLVVCNLSGRPAAWDMPEEFRTARVLISNCGGAPGAELRPWEAAMLISEPVGE